MGDDPENRRLHSWLLLFSFILFMAIFIIVGIFLGFHDKVTTHLSYAYLSNHNETNSTRPPRRLRSGKILRKEQLKLFHSSLYFLRYRTK